MKIILFHQNLSFTLKKIRFILYTQTIDLTCIIVYNIVLFNTLYSIKNYYNHIKRSDDNTLKPKFTLQ